MNQKSPYLISVVGPTAIGKTAMAIHLAQKFKTEIISSDSRQFFKEMRIGTAVPDEDELSLAPHHFIHHKSIFDAYSVGDFERDALDRLKTLFTTHDILVMAGGSGLYVDAVLKGLDVFPEVPPQIRSELNHQLEKEGIQALQKLLQQKDPEYFETVDHHNPQRLIRALEVILGTGKTFSSFRSGKETKRPFKSIKIGLTASRETLYDRINHRVDLMMERGLLEEAKSLFPHKKLNALQTVGYKELFEYFDGHHSLENAVEEIKKNTRRYAKRQLTWFRKDPEILWFDYTTSPEIIQKTILTEINSTQ